MTPNNRLAFDLVKVKVISRSYRQTLAIMSETGITDTNLQRLLRDGHGISFDSATVNPMLHFVISSQVIDDFKRRHINPTMLQLIGTAEVISIESADAALEKWRKMKQA